MTTEGSAITEDSAGTGSSKNWQEFLLLNLQGHLNLQNQKISAPVDHCIQMINSSTRIMSRPVYLLTETRRIHEISKYVFIVRGEIKVYQNYNLVINTKLFDFYPRDLRSRI